LFGGRGQPVCASTLAVKFSQDGSQFAPKSESIFKNTDSLEIETEIIKAEIDQALAYVVVRETVLQSSRGRKLKAQSIATNLFQKMAQRWYLVSHHGSPIMR
jgi:ketosteroid isomerase-like protein